MPDRMDQQLSAIVTQTSWNVYSGCKHGKGKSRLLYMDARKVTACKKNRNNV